DVSIRRSYLQPKLSICHRIRAPTDSCPRVIADNPDRHLPNFESSLSRTFRVDPVHALCHLGKALHPLPHVRWRHGNYPESEAGREERCPQAPTLSTQTTNGEHAQCDDAPPCLGHEDAH